MPLNIWSKLPQKTDAELQDMLAHSESYPPMVITAVKAELARRKTAEKPTEPKADALADTATGIGTTEEGLKWPMRILIFLFPFGLCGIALALRNENKKQLIKARECWVLAGLSIVFYVLLGIVLLMMGLIRPSALYSGSDFDLTRVVLRLDCVLF